MNSCPCGVGVGDRGGFALVFRSLRASYQKEKKKKQLTLEQEFIWKMVSIKELHQEPHQL